MLDINFFAVIVVAIISMALGFLWYSPMLFGKQWMQTLGKTKEQMEADMKGSSMGKTYAAMFVAALITPAVMSVFIKRLGISGTLSGLKLGFALWLGFTLTVQLSTMLFGHRSRKRLVIETAYSLVNLLIMGVILTLWR